MRILVAAASTLLFTSALGQQPPVTTSSAPETASGAPMFGSLPGDEILSEILAALGKR